MTRAADQRCPFLSRPADHLHHPTGRGDDGRYLDQEFVVPLARPAHVAEHQGWRRAGIDDGTVGSVNVLRLRRVGHLLVRLGDHHAGGVVSLPATFLCQLGRVLFRLADTYGDHR